MAKRLLQRLEHLHGAETLAFLDKAGAMRLMRAYASIEKSRMKRALVELAEQIAGRT